MPEENDMIVRDPNNLNGHLGVSDQHWIFFFTHAFFLWLSILISLVKTTSPFSLSFDESRKGMDGFNQTEY